MKSTTAKIGSEGVTLIALLLVLHCCCLELGAGAGGGAAVMGSNELQKLKISAPELKYIGCFDFWKSQAGEFSSTNFFDSNGPEKCEELCNYHEQNPPKTESLLFLRGSFCGCVKFNTSGLIPVEENLCDLSCGEISSNCGGNSAVSVYCNPTRGNLCAEIDIRQVGGRVGARNIGKTAAVVRSEKIAKVKNQGQGQGHALTPCLPCFRCTPPLQCTAGAFHSSLTYMPANSPKVCTEFCANDLEYYDVRDQGYKIRNSTKFANVGWAHRAGIQVSTCGCRNEAPGHEEVGEDEFCQRPCPGDSEQNCGGEAPYYFTLYETSGNSNSCWA